MLLGIRTPGTREVSGDTVLTPAAYRVDRRKKFMALDAIQGPRPIGSLPQDREVRRGIVVRRLKMGRINPDGILSNQKNNAPYFRFFELVH